MAGNGDFLEGSVGIVPVPDIWVPAFASLPHVPLTAVSASGGLPIDFVPGLFLLSEWSTKSAWTQISFMHKYEKFTQSYYPKGQGK